MIPDRFAQGVASGWHVVDAATLERDVFLDCDAVIVGTGAGGGIAAEVLSERGWRVILVEEGPLHTSRDFKSRESNAYPALYQESAARKTKDKAITILQGRSVGGSTTVNWTSSFRTPPDTLAYWQRTFGLDTYSVNDLAPYFEAMERRLSVHRWDVAPNANNDALRRGAERVGITHGIIPRNVKGCYNLGSCGMGCPTNAKQSMLVTTIPAALARGAALYYRLRAQRVVFDGARASELHCVAMAPNGTDVSSRTVRIRARHIVIASGAIGSPALLLRSGAPNPFGTLGARTFLHPTVISAAVMPDVVAGWSGAPQSVYSDYYLHAQPIDAAIGYKLEVPPLHPVLTASILPGFGDEAQARLRAFPDTSVMIALLRDGFHPESPGGRVELRADGTPLLDYPITSYVWDGARRALHAMADLQFAAGARSVFPVHEAARSVSSVAAAHALIDALPMESLRATVVSAHVMGGCGMSADPILGVVDPDGRHHQIENVHVFDGSVFPTSLGANPQLSIYAIARRNAEKLARRA